MSAELTAALEATAEALPELARRLAAEAGAAASDAAGSEGAGLEEAWSARQVLAHLADFELVAAVRVRAVLSLSRPDLPTYGQEEFTHRFANVESAEEAVARFLVVRRSTLRVLKSLTDQDWERTGLHPRRGEETLRRTVEMLVAHDRGHLEQMRAAAR